MFSRETPSAHCFSLALSILWFNASIKRGFRDAPLNGGHGLVLFYLDDGILCGDVYVVAEDLQMIQREGQLLGLELKLSKCKLILASGEPSADIESFIPSRGLT